jgi:3-isopropylmalate/(R)-2-methylmalate dehydratase small subunit
MDPISKIRGRMVPIPENNITTDTITPIRFLKMIQRDNQRLIQALFHDWRFHEDGTLKPDFPMNRPEYQGATILLAGDNFGCGSSRESAPWAVLASGFKAVISTSIADIFRSNSLKNGLIPVIVNAETHKELLDLAMARPQSEIIIDLQEQTISWQHSGEPIKSAKFPIDPFSKTCLLRGVDELGYILRFEEEITAFEKKHLHD